MEDLVGGIIKIRIFLMLNSLEVYECFLCLLVLKVVGSEAKVCE